MDNFLEIDLNEIASKQISEKISSLESDLSKARKTIASQKDEISVLTKKNESAKTAIYLLDYLRDAFSKIEKSEETDGGWFNSKQKNQFLFIESALLNIFHISKEANGWYSSRNDGSLCVHLAVNYYSKKDIVISLLQMIMPNCDKEVAFIRSFRMPYDYTKEEVISYVKSPNYNTNGVIYEIGQYWIERGASKVNMPHSLIMQSPFITDDDVFQILLDTIKKQGSNYYYLFALPVYNKSLTTEQIKAMGECIIKTPVSVLSYDPVKVFVANNLLSFSANTLDYLYGFSESDNQFRMFYWEKFPTEYQMKYLKSKNMEEVLKILTNYSCKWTIEQKKEFLKEYTN